MSGVNYKSHSPKTVNPIPPLRIIDDWREDHAKMMEDMIYEHTKPSFEDLINNLNDLRKQLQATTWVFEFSDSK